MEQTTNKGIMQLNCKKGDYTLIDGKKWKVEEVKTDDGITFNIKWSRNITEELYNKFLEGNQ